MIRKIALFICMTITAVAYAQRPSITTVPLSTSGYCTGTAGTAGPYSLFGLGAGGATCSSAGSAFVGVSFPYAVTLKNLSVVCGTHAVSAGDGVFTVFKQAVGASSFSSTSLTVTYDSGVTNNTLVQDTTHTVSLAAGDLFRVQFTTTTAETLANCRASVEADK